MSLLDQPHHDGSAAYVPPGPVTPGDAVPVRVRVPHAADVQGVWVRTVRDGEPRVTEARLDVRGEHEDTYVADVVVHNPVTGYRFLLGTPRAPGGYRWLDGTGVQDHDVPDAADFRLTSAPLPPSWPGEGTVYQVFPDRFARSAAADERPVPDWAVPTAWDTEPAPDAPLTSTQLYGGDLAGVAEHLDHLESLGVSTLYLTPFFAGRSNHRYDASTFDHVDPLLGGDEALAALSAAVHARGMRLMGDITTNHTGEGHDWFTRAETDPASPEHRMFLWAGQGEIAEGGVDVAYPGPGRPGYVSWLGHGSLPKLDWGSEEVWRRMVDADDSAIARWLQEPYGLDGWRVDVANMTGRYGATDRTLEVARRLRARLTGLRPDAALVAEHFHDYTADLPGDGWHATMNYSGFARPVWGWLADPHGAPQYGLPVRTTPRPAGAMVAAMRAFASRVPWQVAAAQWNLLGSHDTPRLRTVVGSAEAVELAATLLHTYPGTPFVFAGDEVGATGTNGEHGRVTMAWDQAATGGPRWDTATLDVYQALSRLRRGSTALRDGGLRWAVVEDDAVAWLRETPGERVLVVVARAPWSGATLPPAVLGDDAPELLHGGRLVDTPALAVTADGVRLSGEGPAVGVWRLA
ncbi:glycoside hydrolase family 13 protein [Xylanimonas oleitrophica]|uniref:Glycoside hydrolase family 13 protein n=1 Tax=Xylanimonas oleitrophica TaxID=2607479 RepID=A0A2W5X0C5_9MICO|nr:glycoside hydrolase family 13 protein [Xylanimonas oleitrophica]PZR53695.1 glycoside hydrolase family 13 protein [Xylanimonas oleitrophica]